MKTKKETRYEVHYKGEWVASFALECDAEYYRMIQHEAHIYQCRTIQQIEELEMCKISKK
jgi:hypothetical protein